MTKIWDNSEIKPGAIVGEDCVIGHNCIIFPGAVLGTGVRIQCNTDIYDGVTLEDYVFVGPNATFTNDPYPMAKHPNRKRWKKTHVGEGATIGANATILCGVKIGKNALIGAGAVVVDNIPTNAVAVGNPAKVIKSVFHVREKYKIKAA